MSRTTIPFARLRHGSMIALLAVGLAACGGGGSDGGGATTPPVTVQPTVITAQPASQSVTAGQPVTFSVAASGSGLTYQWQRDGKDIPGATAASYTLAAVQASDDGASLTVVVKGGATSVTSSAVTLRVAAASGLSLLAGRPGGAGNLDGTDGRLQNVQAIAVSPAGTLLIVDSPNDDRYASLRSADPVTGAIAVVQRYTNADAPQSMVYDGAGNRYELTVHAIYKTTPAGVRTVFFAPTGDLGLIGNLAVDSGGTLYLSEAFKRTISKIDQRGVQTLLAGRAQLGAADGTGSQAGFYQPDNLTVDRAGNVYVFDVFFAASYIAAKLRKVTPAGVVTTIGPETTGPEGPTINFGTGGALGVDADGNVVLTDTLGGCRVRRLGADGTLTDIAGSASAYGSADGRGDAARFCGGPILGLSGLSADKAGNLYVFDAGLHTVRRISPTGDVTTVAGRAATVANVDGIGAAAAFDVARRMLRAPEDDGSTPVYELVADAQGGVIVGEADRIRRVSAAGAVTTVGSVLPTITEFYSPRYYASGMAYGGDALLVSNGVISRVDANGTLHFVAGRAGASESVDGSGAGASFKAPFGLVVDGLGNIYLHDTPSPNLLKRVERKISPEGVVTTLPVADGPGIFAWYADKDGILWATHFDGSLSRIGPDGKRKQVRAASTGSTFRVLTAITGDAGGNLYVAESASVRPGDVRGPWYLVRKIAPDGSETIVAGTEGSSGFRPGTPGSLGRVEALAVGSDGILYVMSENAVLRVKQ